VGPDKAKRLMFPVKWPTLF